MASWFNNGSKNGLWVEVVSDSGKVIEVAKPDSADELVRVLNELEAFKAKVLGSKRIHIWWRQTAEGDELLKRATSDENVWQGSTLCSWDRIEQVFAVPVDAVEPRSDERQRQKEEPLRSPLSPEELEPVD